MMDPFPTYVDLAENPTTGQGHHWMFEYVEGVPLRFTLQSDGRLAFAGKQRRYEDSSEPPSVAPAIETVRSGFRRDAFREAVAEPDSVTFYGIATCQHRIEYDWDELPAFLGYDVRVPGRGGLLAPERAHASFDRLGLAPAPPVDREIRADAIDPGREQLPDSDWADRPVAGLVFADKHGWRGKLLDPDRPPGSEASFDSPASAAEALLSGDLPASGNVEATLRQLARRYRATLADADVDPTSSAFRSAVAEHLQRRSK
ncbi:Uncharacterized protein HSBGL_1157 [Halapricum desulfuricans]|uniref:RNA ligase domain-containing protein n=2 Tax=Halapricum desulfuricans TaxID=2841257 RepID=A0A897NGW3_9EURY|nr:Uncharacterized protein HSBGL_1157 [Halapricum desulfuricans]